MPPSYSTIDQAILRLTRARGRDKTVCPSEVARQTHGENWRAGMEAVRHRARYLACAGKIDITQAGAAIDPGGEWRGPIRFRWRPGD